MLKYVSRVIQKKMRNINEVMRYKFIYKIVMNLKI